jgi:hypothetical protein
MDSTGPSAVPTTLYTNAIIWFVCEGSFNSERDRQVE